MSVCVCVCVCVCCVCVSTYCLTPLHTSRVCTERKLSQQYCLTALQPILLCLSQPCEGFRQREAEGGRGKQREGEGNRGRVREQKEGGEMRM